MTGAVAAQEEIVVNLTPQETRIAVLQSGIVQEVQIERAAARGIVGDIYRGRVVRVLPGMQSAFIDIGQERAAFLHVADLAGHSATSGLPIEKVLAEGQALTVQVTKDPIGSKGARLTTQLSIAGRLLVYLPHESHIGISQRIENEQERVQLRDRLTALLPAGTHGGYIIRTVAETADESELAADVAYLHKQWQAIEARALGAEPPALLYQDLDLVLRVLRDYVTQDTARIFVDSRETFARAHGFACAYTPKAAERLQLYIGERPLFDLYGVEDEIERALARRVDLKSGGYLIIDQTEALTTVDVNTGGFVGVRSFDETIFKTNLEAAQSIARQLRLRNLGGIIIVDFIDMHSGEHRDAVLGELRRALARDRTRMTVNGFSALGLVEMTRKRTRESLAHVLCEPCPTCLGRGALKTARTACYEILRELTREARQFEAREFRILASQAVTDMFLDEESQNLAMLSAFIGKPVFLQVETSYHQEQYDIVLL